MRPQRSAELLLAAPLFGAKVGAQALAEVSVRLEGLVRSPRRVAALLSIGGAPSVWLEIGQSKDGVTLQDVDATSAVIETSGGPREVVLGAAASPSNPDVPPGEPPPGGRQPLAPASAPGSPQ